MCHSEGAQLTPLAHIHFSHQHSALPGACPGAQSFTISQGLPAAQPASCAAPATSWAGPHTATEVLSRVASQALVCFRGDGDERLACRAPLLPEPVVVAA